jgi:hypothetical protein
MYGKIFASTFTGSMFGAGADVFAVWGYVLAHTVDSTVELNPTFLGAVLGMEPERVAAAIEKLSASDPRSRNPQNDGRRLVHERGFQYHVTSHEIYRNIRNDDERREYNREAQRRSRANAAVVKSVNDGQRQSAMSAHTESEAESEAEAEADRSAPWAPWQWKYKYGIHWSAKYGGAGYGMPGDSRACSTLGDLLDALPDKERRTAQGNAPKMFAEYLKRSGRDAQRRHPFAFFVQEFGGLRVPQQEAEPVESFAVRADRARADRALEDQVDRIRDELTPKAPTVSPRAEFLARKAAGK